MGFAGGANKKRKRAGGNSSPAKKGSSSTNPTTPAGLLPPLGRSAAASMGAAWAELLELPGENTKDKCANLLADIYNPLRRRVYEEIKDRRFRNLYTDSTMWNYAKAAAVDDPRLNWLRNPESIPPGMRRNAAHQVHPHDFLAWDWLREVVPSMRGLENTRAVADATDPDLWGEDPPGQSTGQKNVAFGDRGTRVDADALRQHLKKECDVTLNFLVTRIRDFVLRALEEIRQRREARGPPSTAVSSIPPLNLRRELAGTPPPPPMARPVGMEQFVPSGVQLDYGSNVTPASTSDANAAGVVPLVGGTQDTVPSTTTSSVVEASLLDNTVEDSEMPSLDEGEGKNAE